MVAPKDFAHKVKSYNHMYFHLRIDLRKPHVNPSKYIAINIFIDKVTVND